MESLESRVRELLIQKRRDEACAITQEPKYKGLVRDYTRIVVASSVKAAGKDFREEELAEAEKEIEQMLFMREQLGLLAPHCTYSKQDVVEHFSIIAHPLLVPPYDENNNENKVTISKYLKLKEELSFLAGIQDRIVESLTQVAEIEGVEKALTDENEYAAIRRIFPTKDEYIAHRWYEMQVLKEFSDYLAIEYEAEKVTRHGGGLMYIDDDESTIEESLKTMLEMMERAFEGMKEMREHVFNDELLKKAQKIYGA